MKTKYNGILKFSQAQIRGEGEKLLRRPGMGYFETNLQ